MITLELPIGGMDCAACAKKVQRALKKLPGVVNVEVLLSAEKAVIDHDPKLVTREALQATVEKVGFTVPAPQAADTAYMI